MVQLQHIYARLDILSDELYQVNTYVGRITQHQAVMGGFVASPPPTPEASEDEDDDEDDDDDDDATAFDDEDNGNATSSSADEMST